MHHIPPAAACAALSAGAGCVTAIAMCGIGGSLSAYLPAWPGLAAAAALGAALAGWALSAAMGRGGRWGAALGIAGAVILTGVGAVLGGLIWTSVAALASPQGTLDQAGAGAGLGALAVLDGLMSSPAVAALWTLAMTGVHLGTARARGHAPVT